jgi:hypothetical protein
MVFLSGMMTPPSFVDHPPDRANNVPCIGLIRWAFSYGKTY